MSLRTSYAPLLHRLYGIGRGDGKRIATSIMESESCFPYVINQHLYRCLNVKVMGSPQLGLAARYYYFLGVRHGLLATVHDSNRQGRQDERVQLAIRECDDILGSLSIDQKEEGQLVFRLN